MNAKESTLHLATLSILDHPHTSHLSANKRKSGLDIELIKLLSILEKKMKETESAAMKRVNNRADELRAHVDEVLRHHSARIASIEELKYAVDCMRTEFREAKEAFDAIKAAFVPAAPR